MPGINNLINLLSRNPNLFLTPGFNPEASHPLLRGTSDATAARQSPPLFTMPDPLGVAQAGDATRQQVQTSAPPPATRPRTVTPQLEVGDSQVNLPAAVQRPLRVSPAPAEQAAGSEPASRPRVADTEKYERGAYVGEHGKRSFKEVLRSMLLGAAEGAARSGTWQGAVGGAAGGAAGQLVTPQGMAGATFDRQIAPLMQAREQRLAQKLKAALEQAQMQSQVKQQQAQTTRLKKQPYNVGGVALDPETLEPIYEPPAKASERYRAVPGGGLFDTETQTFVEGAKPPAKAPTPHWVQTDEGYVDLNAPENKGKRFRPPARAARPDGAAARQVNNQLRQDIRAFERAKAKADRLWRASNGQPTAENQAALNEAKALAAQIAASYGDLVEVGAGNGWPYVKQRGTPARRAANSDQEMLEAVRQNPQLYIDEMRRAGMTDAQIESALKAAGVK